MKRYFFVFAFLFVVLCNVSWAGVEGRVKCGETATIYNNLNSTFSPVKFFVTVLVTDKCPGLDSAIIYYNEVAPGMGEEVRLPVPDGQSTSATIFVPRRVTIPDGNGGYIIKDGTIKLECNGTTGKGSCSFVIIDVKY